MRISDWSSDVCSSDLTASYRARGADGVIYASKGPKRLGFGAGDANRKLYSPNTPGGAIAYGIEDQSVYGQFFVQRALDANSSLEGDVFANWYKPGFAGAENIFSTRSEEHTSELQSLMRNSYAVFCV